MSLVGYTGVKVTVGITGIGVIVGDTGINEGET
jgi:hypothetical protein